MIGEDYIELLFDVANSIRPHICFRDKSKNNALVAWCSFHIVDFSIGMLYVYPKYRKKGLA